MQRCFVDGLKNKSAGVAFKLIVMFLIVVALRKAISSRSEV